jgi:FMN phosphatase YigB (HAD superfamily)
LKIEFVYFDLDDTLVETTATVAEAYEAALAELRPAVAAAGGAVPPPELEAEMTGTFGSTMPEEYIRAWLYEAGVTDGLRDELAARGAALFNEGIGGIPAFPEAGPVLERLAAEGFGLGVITDGRVAEQRMKLERAGLAAFFGPTFISEDYPVFKHKPGQMMFRDALAAAARPPAAVMYVGDRNKDVIGANLAGMVSVRVRQGWANRRPSVKQFAAAQADYVIDNLGELPDLIARHNVGEKG